jgi:EAL domain-containing protein (putative c-di-GMP-specific phosphodiesterase class I)
VPEALNCEITHFAALRRISDDDNPIRFLGPTEFILHAEKSGRIMEMDRWEIKAVVQKLSWEALINSSLAVNESVPT